MTTILDCLSACQDLGCHDLVPSHGKSRMIHLMILIWSLVFLPQSGLAIFWSVASGDVCLIGSSSLKTLSDVQEARPSRIPPVGWEMMTTGSSSSALHRHPWTGSPALIEAPSPNMACRSGVLTVLENISKQWLVVLVLGIMGASRPFTWSWRGGGKDTPGKQIWNSFQPWWRGANSSY